MKSSSTVQQFFVYELAQNPPRSPRVIDLSSLILLFSLAVCIAMVLLDFSRNWLRKLHFRRFAVHKKVLGL